MKPITNILLVAVLIFYVFLPFYSISLFGSITGLKYSAGLITENLTLLKTLFALVPFLACFGAITFNSMKHRYWGIVAGFFILAGIMFFVVANQFHDLPLTHDPELVGNDVQEGFKIDGYGIGYWLSYGTLWLALISCIVSLMPFKFNLTLERAIDEHLEDGKRHLEKMGRDLHDEYHRLESKTAGKKPRAKHPQEPPAPAQEAQPQHKENPADYMPQDQRPQQSSAAPATSSEASPAGDNPYAAYMPKDPTAPTA